MGPPGGQGASGWPPWSWPWSWRWPSCQCRCRWWPRVSRCSGGWCVSYGPGRTWVVGAKCVSAVVATVLTSVNAMAAGALSVGWPRNCRRVRRSRPWWRVWRRPCCGSGRSVARRVAGRADPDRRAGPRRRVAVSCPAPAAGVRRGGCRGWWRGRRRGWCGGCAGCRWPGRSGWPRRPWLWWRWVPWWAGWCRGSAVRRGPLWSRGWGRGCPGCGPVGAGWVQAHVGWVVGVAGVAVLTRFRTAFGQASWAWRLLKWARTEAAQVDELRLIDVVLVVVELQRRRPGVFEGARQPGQVVAGARWLSSSKRDAAGLVAAAGRVADPRNRGAVADALAALTGGLSPLLVAVDTGGPARWRASELLVGLWARGPPAFLVALAGDAAAALEIDGARGGPAGAVGTGVGGAAVRPVAAGGVAPDRDAFACRVAGVGARAGGAAGVAVVGAAGAGRELRGLHGPVRQAQRAADEHAAQRQWLAAVEAFQQAQRSGVRWRAWLARFGLPGRLRRELVTDPGLAARRAQLEATLGAPGVGGRGGVRGRDRAAGTGGRCGAAGGAGRGDDRRVLPPAHPRGRSGRHAGVVRRQVRVDLRGLQLGAGRGVQDLQR